MKNKRLATKIILLSFSAFFIVYTLLLSNKNTGQYIPARASQEDDANYCVNPPDCCARMAESHSAYECEWPIRGYCKNCGDIEGRTERCGWYWIYHDTYTNSPNGYGCMIGTENNMRPIYGSGGSPLLAPTNPPQPTLPLQPTTPPQPTLPPPPAIIPTNPPPQAPPNNTFNLQKSVSLPSVTPVTQNTFTLPQLAIPQFKLPVFEIHLNGQKINEEAAKPLGFFEYLFNQVVYYDQLLEQTINEKLKF